MAFVAGQAFARIGENQIQHEQRYGRARGDAGTNNTATLQMNCKKTYDFQGWQLVVNFEAGRAEMIQYWNYDGVAKHHIQAILQAEAGGGKWTEISAGRWINSNGRILEGNTYLVRVRTSAFAAREAAAAAARRAPKPSPAF